MKKTKSAKPVLLKSKKMSEKLNLLLQSLRRGGFNLELGKVVHFDSELEVMFEEFCDFLNVNKQEGLLLLSALNYIAENNHRRHFSDAASINKLASAMKKEFIELFEMRNDLLELHKRGFVKINSVCQYDFEYEINSHLVKALITESKKEIEKIKNSQNPLSILKNIESMLLKGVLTNVDEFPLVYNFLQLHPQLEQVRALMDEIECPYEKIFMLMMICRYAGSGDSSLDMEDLTISQRTENFRFLLPFNFFDQLFEGSYYIVKQGYVYFSTDKASLSECIYLSEEICDSIAEISGRRNLKKKKTRTTSIITPGEIAEIPLFFSESFQENVSKLKIILSKKTKKDPEKFSPLNNFPMNILFYGFPGTGKTELAYQLAKATQRDVMAVNISSIRDMWVGNSEKNVKRIFTDYYTYSKKCDQLPILLFNEADAILTNRLSAVTSTDNMNNTMQNILLEELERFDGIFIATTNLHLNLDDAFDRRFLFKLEFEKPDDFAKLKMLRFWFEWLNEEQAQIIAQSYDFSGGQLLNVMRKLAIDIDFVGIQENEYYSKLHQYIEQEVNFRGSTGLGIGFKKSA